jgi:hypothetical protein
MRPIIPVLSASLLVALASCSDSGDGDVFVTFDSTSTTTSAISASAPGPSTSAAGSTTSTATGVATTTVAATVPSTTVAAVSTVAEPSTTVGGGVPVATDVAVPSGPMFSDGLGVKVDSAPGVATRGDTRQLMPEGLYVHIAWEPDPNDASVFTVRPEDIEILEAYANASRAFYEAATTDLIIDPGAFAPYMTDAGAQFETSLAAAAAGGFVDTLGAGVVLRPYLLADDVGTGSARILDCTLSDEQFVLRGSQRANGEFVRRGQTATMVQQDGVWKVEAFGEEPRACV